MKCPKCGYLGFEHVDRCRNCGYDFSLSESSELPELPIRGDEARPAPLEDLAMVDAALTPRPRTYTVSPSELPLFEPSPGQRTPMGSMTLATPGSEEEPLIARPLRPRPPLAVRRSTPEVPRVRAEQPRTQMLDLDLDALSTPSAVPLTAPRSLERQPVVSQPSAPADAGLIARFIAAVIDLTILAAIDVVVIYFTTQICGITIDDVGILPKGPLLAFLLVQNGGYLVAFTASGQTLGKMAVKIKVVTEESRSRLDLGHAVLRTLVWIILAIPAGLGFLTTLFGTHGRGLHDRFAGTRVIRALA